jgi:hypothetical protein
MSSITYSFHWVRQSLDRKKQKQQQCDGVLESHESIPTINSSVQSKFPSLIWFNQLFKTELINQEHQYPQFDFEFLHSIL